jgi:predicted RNA-binding Zn-ribbon protein involved in translation (DUF1610 family)
MPTFTIDGQPLPADYDSGWPVDESAVDEYVERPLARCQACGAELHELKDKRENKLRFMCVEPTCGKRYYLDFGALVSMKETK